MPLQASTIRVMLHRARRRFGIVAYPILAATYPVLALYSVNLREMVPLEQLLAPLTAAVLVTALLLALLRIAFADWQRAGILTLVFVVLFFTYGGAWDAMPSDLVGGHLTLLGVWIALAAATTVVVRGVRGQDLARATPLLNVVVALLVLANVVAIGGFQLSLRADASSAAGAAATRGPDLGTVERLPDIYWIVLDRYGSEAVIRDYYDHDISAFIDGLRERGFYVADGATANYRKTAPSLVSIRNMDYLDGDALRERAIAGNDWGPLYRDLSRSFPVLEILRSLGYRFVYSGTYWEFTASHPAADVNYRYEGARGEFATVLASGTLLRATEALGEGAIVDGRRERWELTRFQWDALGDAIRLGSPKFVHAHFALPHEPYVFRADGSFLPEDVAESRSLEENYADQVEYANASVLAFIDELLAARADDPPIVILQGEEGPYPPRSGAPGFSWAADATDEELHRKFGVLSAYLLPGLPSERAEEAGLYRSISLVNQFRVILSHYFAANLEPLPDRNFIWASESELYDFVDVTQRVQRMVERTQP